MPLLAPAWLSLASDGSRIRPWVFLGVFVSVSGNHPDEETLRAPSDDRLESWKEIAGFLQRDVRTVQRWEKLAGLPVHRHAESRLRTPYAFKSELEHWRSTQRAVADPAVREPDGVGRYPGEDARLPTSPFVPRRQWSLLALLLAAIVVLAAAGIFFRRAASSPETLADAPIEVLIARLEHKDADPKLAAAIEQAARRRAAEVGRFELVSPVRVARGLRLLRQQADALLTEELARQVAVRDGGIRFVITGTVDKLPSHHFANLRAIDPESRLIASVDWHGATAEQLLLRAAEATERLLASLWNQTETAEKTHREPLELVTSGSTEAVRLYTAAVQAGARREWPAAELLARRGTAADPELAAAHAWTAWALRRQGRPLAESLEHIDRAMQLAHDLTDRENFLISGMYHSMTGDLHESTASLEAALRLYPRDRQVLDFLIDVSWRQGKLNRAVDLSTSRAHFYQDDFFANVTAAQALLTVRGAPERVAFFVRRARETASPQAVFERPAWNAWLQLVPVYERWVTGDRDEAVALLDQLARGLGGMVSRERDAFATALGFANLAFDRAREAELSFRLGSSPGRQVNLAMLAAIQGRTEAARGWLEQVREHGALRPALFAHLGFEREAERGLASALPSAHAEGVAAVTRGLLAARKGHVSAATAALRNGAQLLRATGEPEYFLAIDALADLALAQGATDQAVRLLSEANTERLHTYAATQWTAAYWRKLNGDLAAILRLQGRHEEADRVSSNLRPLRSDGRPPSAEAAKAQSR
jgi:tetratricopeptide (TPR) repeat protein